MIVTLPRRQANPVQRRKSLEGGFTLLEAIVTLVIVSLIVTVLMQALAQTLDMRRRLVRYQSEVRLGALQEQWFRDSVSSAVPDLPDALGPFKGSARALQLVSAAPLSGGGLQPVHWTLSEAGAGFAMQYRDGTGMAFTVLEGPLWDARFEYQTPEGEWLSQWPPGEGDPQPGQVELPSMVRLKAGTARGGLTWLVAIPIDPFARGNLRPDGPGGI